MHREDASQAAEPGSTDAAAANEGDRGASSEGRFKPGFAWGLAAGAVAVVAILVVGGIAQTAIRARATESQFVPYSQPQLASVVVTAVPAGGDWFSVDASDTGRLEGWATGEMGYGDFPEPPGAIGYVDVVTVGLLDGVKVKHAASVYVTPRTKVYIGDKPAAVDDVFDDDKVGDRTLTVEFHRWEQDLVADQIRASAAVGENPLNY